MALRGRSLIPFSQSTASQSRDVVPSQSRFDDHVPDYQQPEPDESREVIPAPRTSWWSLLKKDSAPPRNESEIRNRDDDEYDYPESRHYPVDHHYPEDRHYPESYRESEDHRYPVSYRQPDWHRYPVSYRQPDEHHYPESYHYRSPPPAPYRTSEQWDDDPRAAHPINVHVHVENHNENHHEIEASDNSGGLGEKAILTMAAIGGLIVLAVILNGGHGWGP
jgi:hypothetical protein